MLMVFVSVCCERTRENHGGVVHTHTKYLSCLEWLWVGPANVVILCKQTDHDERNKGDILLFTIQTPVVWGESTLLIEKGHCVVPDAELNSNYYLKKQPTCGKWNFKASACFLSCTCKLIMTKSAHRLHALT